MKKKFLTEPLPKFDAHLTFYLYSFDHMAYYTERRSDYAWNWFLILLLPLFFLFGWVANDYTQNRVTQPQPGVGGGPPETRDLGATVTPTATPTEEPTPTTVITPTVEETKTPEITE